VDVKEENTFLEFYRAKRAFNKLISQIKEREFEIELEEVGPDLFSQVASEYILQLNREIQEVREYCEVMGKLREAEDWAGLLRQKRPNTAGMEIVEWKTIQARQKRYLAKEGPRDTYVAQLALYIWLLRGRGDGKLVYVVADNGWRKEYRVTVDGDDVFVNDARFASITAYLDDFRRVDAVVAEGKVPLRPYEPKVTKSGLYDLAAYEAKRNIWNCNPRWCRYSSWCLAGVPKGPKIREKEGFF